MPFGFAGAASGASDALQELLATRRAAYLQQQQQQMAEAALKLRQEEAARQGAQFDATLGLQNQRLGLEREQFKADETERGRVATRQGMLDERQATQDRQVGNQQGVRRMIGDWLVQRGSTPLDPGARQTLQGMAIQENVELPESIVTDPNAENQQRIDLENLRHKNELAQIAARGSEDRRTQSAKPATGSAAGALASPYAAERAQRTVGAIDALIPKVSRWTTGVGSMLSGVPETEARNFAAELQTLKANIAFNELAQMRAASRTGGALGAVSDRELGLLESALGALDTGQSPENIKQQLEQIKQSVLAWQAAQIQTQPQSQPGDTVTITGGEFDFVPGRGLVPRGGR